MDIKMFFKFSSRCSFIIAYRCSHFKIFGLIATKLSKESIDNAKKEHKKLSVRMSLTASISHYLSMLVYNALTKMVIKI